jgi:acetylornithine deacetylase
MKNTKEFISTKTAAWTKQLQDLIRIPSYFEREHAVISFVAAKLKALGIEPILVPFEPSQLATLRGAQQPFSAVTGRYNVVGHVRGSGGGRSMIVNSHIDIVAESAHELWSLPPFSGQIDPEKRVVYGRGAMDNKAGAAIALAFAEMLVNRPSPLAGDVIFHFVLEDEVTGNGSLLCLEAGHVADGAVILDGTRLATIVDQQVGNLQFDVEVIGKSVSVSVSHMGANAGEMLAGLLLDLKRMVHDMNDSRSAPWTMYPTPNQFVIKQMTCDSRHLSVPDQATGTAFLTFTPPLTIAAMKTMIEERAKAFAAANAWVQPPKINWNSLTAEPCATSSAAFGEVLRTHVGANTGTTPDLVPSTGTSDLRHFSAYGVPCVLFGPGRGYNPHRADEYYHIDDLPLMVAILNDTATAWCGEK